MVLSALTAHESLCRIMDRAGGSYVGLIKDGWSFILYTISFHYYVSYSL